MHFMFDSHNPPLHYIFNAVCSILKAYFVSSDFAPLYLRTLWHYTNAVIIIIITLISLWRSFRLSPNNSITTRLKCSGILSNCFLTMMMVIGVPLHYICNCTLPQLQYRIRPEPAHHVFHTVSGFLPPNNNKCTIPVSTCLTADNNLQLMAG